MVNCDDITVWRVNILPDSAPGVDAFDYCKRNKIIGIGWPLPPNQKANDFNDYAKKRRAAYGDDGSFTRAINAIGRMKPNDLVWTRQDGIYYLCRITSSWRYIDSPESRDADIANVVDVDDFIKVGVLDKVPGKVKKSMDISATAQRINGIASITANIYNMLTKSNFYSVINKFNVDVFDILSAEATEEIVCLYLQIEKGYVVYTSTCKKSTAKYECVMVNKDNGSKCYPQVKTGSISLNRDDYSSFASNNDKVYLFATSENYKGTANNNIICLSRAEILDFISRYRKIMPVEVTKIP